MRIEIFGKQDCTLCKSARRKVRHFLSKWGKEGDVEVVFVDMETEYGAAEGDFFDVLQIPAVLVKGEEDELLARWDGKKSPVVKELKKAVAA